MAFEYRWKLDNLGLVQFAPWHRFPGAEDADGDIPAGFSAEERANSQLPSGSSASPRGDGSSDRYIFIETKKRPPRDLYLT